MAVLGRGRGLAVAEGALAVTLALTCLAPVALAATDVELLQAFRASFTNGETALADWVGEDPCNFGFGYSGVSCNNNRAVYNM